MNCKLRIREALAAGMAAAMLGGLMAAPVTARADDPKDNKPAAGKGKEKKPTIPIKIVDPIIVPDKGKDKPGK